MFPVLLTVLLSCCKRQEIYKDKYTLAEEETVLNIPIGKDSRNISGCIQYYESGETAYLAVSNLGQYSIEIYDLNRRELVNTIRPEKEGSNAFFPFSFYVKCMPGKKLSVPALT